MNGNSLSGKMHAASMRLAATWAEVARDWQDEVATRFGNEFWEPLDEAVGRYRAALEELEAALDEADRD